MKAALGLPPQAHHTDLLQALGVPSIQEILRGTVLRGLRNALKSEHRLSIALRRSLSVLAVDPAQLDGSFLGLVYSICNCDFGNVLSVASGHIDQEMIRPQLESDGVVDSLRFLAARTDSVARHLMRLIVMPHLQRADSSLWWLCTLLQWSSVTLWCDVLCVCLICWVVFVAFCDAK